MTGRIASITYAPVKGLGLTHVQGVDLEPTGVRENRRFYLIGDDGRLVNGKAHVGRCAVTTHDPDTGVPDLDTLRILTGYRSDVESEEPLPIGVWGRVEQAGRVGVGDPVEPL